MNRAVWPTVGVLALAGAFAGASVLPVQVPSAGLGTPDDDRARVAVVCPTVAGTAEITAIAAGSPQGSLGTAPLARPDSATAISGSFGVTTQASGPMLVTAPRLDVFSGTTRTAASAGSDRGLSMMSCDRPTASQWFTGVQSSKTGTADLVLFNADAQDASVDLTVYGAGGRVTAPGSRGIIVPAHSRRVVPLGPLFTAEQPVSIKVATSAGRVAAAVRQRMLNGDAPAGSDWLPPTADPASAVVIPGLPAGKGVRDLVVVNPGDRTASVALQVLGPDGPTAVPGFETLDLPPGTSRSIPLGGALAQTASGLRLSSEQKITAGVLSSNGEGAAAIDIATQVATAPLTGPGVLALSPGAAVSPVLHLTGGTNEPASVRVRVTNPGGSTLLDRTVSVPGFADSTLTLPKAGDVLVSVEPAVAGSVHASVYVQTKVDAVVGVASLAVLPGAAAATLPPIRQDPRVGS